MDVQKILIVVIFLTSLLLLQYLLKRFREKNTTPTGSADGIKLQSRLQLSRDERVDLVSIQGRPYFIVLSKGAQPTVQAIEPEKAVINQEIES